MRQVVGFKSPFTLFTAVAIAFAFALAAPVSAHADGFSMPKVSIHATVEPDGGLSVTEARRFEFDDSVNGVYWIIPAGTNQQGTSTSLSIQGVSVDDGVGAREFASKDSATNGDDGVYEVAEDSDATTLKVYTPHSDGDEATVTVRYALTGAVMAWSDTAELYWKFVSDGWAGASHDVSLTVDFAGADAAPEPAEDGFRAWAHGPLTGTVTPHRDTRTVDFQVPRVGSDEFAEARIAFPTAWVPHLVAVQEARMGKILGEERAWAAEANARRERARMLVGALTVAQAAVPALFAGAMVLLKLRHPKPKPAFTDTYLRDLPSDDHPAVIAAFMNRGGAGDEAIVSTLMKLTDDRVIALKPTKRTEKGLFGRERQEDDYVLRMTEEGYDRATDSIDRAALDLYFAGCEWREPEEGDAGATAAGAQGGRHRSRTFSGLPEYAEHDPESYSDAFDTFKTEVEARYEMRDLVASTGTGWMVASALIGTALGAGLILSLAFICVDAFAPVALVTFLVGLACIAVGIVCGCTMRRDTREGAELRARCTALKRWLEDFTRLGEAVPGDLVLWDRLLVMAVALGVSDEVLRQLADAVPESMRGSDDVGYTYPVSWWCHGHHGMASPAESLHRAYTTSTSALAGSLDSSGGGYGGGFSGGGGGGVGGGGGGGTF